MKEIFRMGTFRILVDMLTTNTRRRDSNPKHGRLARAYVKANPKLTRAALRQTLRASGLTRDQADNITRPEVAIRAGIRYNPTTGVATLVEPGR